MAMKFPFVPKSTSHLEPGQFFSIELPSGGFGCGLVLQLKEKSGKRDSRQLIVGLTDWFGDSIPKAADAANSEVIAHGQVHVKTVGEVGGKILGIVPIGADRTPLSLSESPGKNCMLVRGYQFLRPATIDEQSSLAVFSTWGYKIIQIIADRASRGAA